MPTSACATGAARPCQQLRRPRPARGRSKADRDPRARAAAGQLQGHLEGALGRYPSYRGYLRLRGETMTHKIAVLADISIAMALSVAQGRDYHVGSLDIAGPWSRATPKGASVAAGYMTIKNNGTAPDRLIGGSSDAAAKFELHQMSMANGVMKMRPIKSGLEI